MSYRSVQLYLRTDIPQEYVYIKYTYSLLLSILQKGVKYNVMVVDFIVPYVDNTDPAWLSSYYQATNINTLKHRSGINSPRFRSFDMLKYIFRSIEKHFTFPYRIILVVASMSQVPAWVNTSKVRIVTHEEYIPQEFLPTFNSCTIEAFLPLIPDLNDFILYSNDDILFMNDINFQDCFDPHSLLPKLHFSVIEKYHECNIFRCQCRSNLELLNTKLHCKRPFPINGIIKPQHNVIPMLKSTLNTVYHMYKEDIPEHISLFRERKNINQYFYSLYHYYTDAYTDGPMSNSYVSLTVGIPRTVKVIERCTACSLCINDGVGIDYSSAQRAISRALELKFPTPSSFEL